MFNLPQFKQVVSTAGLSKAEIAQVYGVSRQTVYGWLDGPPPKRGSYTERMAVVITRALLAAVQRGVLPMPPLDRDERRRRMAKMATTLRNLKPEPIA